MTKTELAKIIDYTLLKPETAENDIKRICAEAEQYKFGAVCIPLSYIKLARKLLENTDIKICTVIGFPLGNNPTKIKILEAKEALKDGADELDMVMNIGELKDKKDAVVFRDIREIVTAAKGRIVKVIIETGLLTEEEKRRACRLVKESGAQFVKTCTGFNNTGIATVEDIKLIREVIGSNLGIKASSGIKTAKQALALIEAGANRLGTSAAVSILDEIEE